MAQYCCKWNEHVPNLLTRMENLKAAESYVDVTLVCESRTIKAHKLILSTCSGLLHRMFSSNPCAHPIIILQDMKFSILQAVINFMYRGEIRVLHDELGLLLKAAKALGIKGLSDMCKEMLLGALISDMEMQGNDDSVNVPLPSSSPRKKKGRKRSHDLDISIDKEKLNAKGFSAQTECTNFSPQIVEFCTFSTTAASSAPSSSDPLHSATNSVLVALPIKRNATTSYEENPYPSKQPIIQVLQTSDEKAVVLPTEPTDEDEEISEVEKSDIQDFTSRRFDPETVSAEAQAFITETEVVVKEELVDDVSEAVEEARAENESYVVIKDEILDDQVDFPRKKTSKLWKYFTKKSNMTAQCNSCLSYQSYRASITNLKKHLQRKHPSIDLGSSSRNDDENIEFQVEPIAQVPAPPKEKHPCRNLTGKGQKKSYLWNFYTPLNDEVAVCNICLKNMSYKSSTSNLKSHLMNKHPSLDLQSAQELQELAERNRFQSEITDFETHTVAMTVEEAMNEGLVYQPDEETLQQISICNNVVSEGQTEPTNNAASISQGKPPHSQLGKKKSYLWNFFTPLNDEMASCKICSAEKSYRSSISNLKKHLMRTHPTIKLPSATMNSSQSSTPQVTLMVAEVQPEVASTNEEVLQEITVQSNMLSDENSMLSPFILKFA